MVLRGVPYSRVLQAYRCTAQQRCMRTIVYVDKIVKHTAVLVSPEPVRVWEQEVPEPTTIFRAVRSSAGLVHAKRFHRHYTGVQHYSI